MKEKFLPIGTVVLLKNGTKKIMITGYLPVSKDENTSQHHHPQQQNTVRSFQDLYL